MDFHFHGIYYDNVKMVFGLMSGIFADDPGDRGSIPGQVIPKTQKMVPDVALLSTQHYKVRVIKGKVEQSREWSSALPYTLVWELLKREPLGHQLGIWWFAYHHWNTYHHRIVQVKRTCQDRDGW